jgi:hypothetical protein
MARCKLFDLQAQLALGPAERVWLKPWPPLPDDLGPTERVWFGILKPWPRLPDDKPHVEALGHQPSAGFKRALREIMIEYLDRQFARIDKQRWKDRKRAHREEALKEAREKRDQWSKADVAHLLKIGGLNTGEQHQLARLLLVDSKPGRGVINFKSLAERIYDESCDMSRICDPTTPAHSCNRGKTRIVGRLDLLKRMWWWPLMVDAAYEGELIEQRKDRSKLESPERRAEKAVADVIGIDEEEAVRPLRRLREKAHRKLARGFPPHWPITAAKLKRMIETGDLLPE